MKLSSIVLAISALAYLHTTTANSCKGLDSTKAVDECYMKIALDYALIHNPRFPFGALIVDHTKNDISCYGVNSSKQNKLLHGESAAFWNVYRGIHRVVWGTSILDLNKSDCQQLMINMHDVVASAKLGANLPNPEIPILEGGVLKDECDHAFWCAFSIFRGKKYHAAMIKDGHQEYIKDCDARFKCKTVPMKNHGEL